MIPFAPSIRQNPETGPAGVGSFKRINEVGPEAIADGKRFEPSGARATALPCRYPRTFCKKADVPGGRRSADRTVDIPPLISRRIPFFSRLNCCACATYESPHSMLLVSAP